MIHDLILRGVVTGLFTVGAIECGLPILTRRLPWTVVINHSLHFLMAVAMAVMAWPWGAHLPTTGPAAFFVLAAIWFLVFGAVATRSPGARVLYGYHVLMMLASAWMYASMNGSLSFGRSSVPPAPAMPGIDMGPMVETSSGDVPAWFAAVNWLGVVVFGIAATFWAFRHFHGWAHCNSRPLSWGNLAQAMLAAGMAILFLAAVVEI